MTLTSTSLCSLRVRLPSKIPTSKLDQQWGKIPTGEIREIIANRLPEDSNALHHCKPFWKTEARRETRCHRRWRELGIGNGPRIKPWRAQQGDIRDLGDVAARETQQQRPEEESHDHP